MSYCQQCADKDRIISEQGAWIEGLKQIVADPSVISYKESCEKIEAYINQTNPAASLDSLIEKVHREMIEQLTEEAADVFYKPSVSDWLRRRSQSASPQPQGVKPC